MKRFMENYRGFKKDLLDMKSLNLCSRLPNLFEITHLQKAKGVKNYLANVGLGYCIEYL